ncbi:hypothetical protein PAXRUDRAFT_233605 [Paxillus rubicundulus Ve08.2h10]|uniref:Uncharacterized protein n=1 Tax=Paxillus rubicundulus Ve08.2h10 TaxID=930991 RepID=A0A0D0DGY6_9AGAM|nr:hypothetical protein PAXRUDRAFT_233605 [Paxillus rubicundulus Ve08.2h10]
MMNEGRVGEWPFYTGAASSRRRMTVTDRPKVRRREYKMDKGGESGFRIAWQARQDVHILSRRFGSAACLELITNCQRCEQPRGDLSEFMLLRGSDIGHPMQTDIISILPARRFPPSVTQFRSAWISVIS